MSFGKPLLGVLCWEAGLGPRGLEQLEKLHGNSTNPATYGFPVEFRRVRGACTRTIIDEPDPAVRDRMIAEGLALCQSGVKAVTTSCGFNALLQGVLASALPVPVLSSSLIQIPWIRSILRNDAEIAVITAKGAALKTEHFLSVGVKDMEGIHVLGMEENEEWNKIFSAPKEDVDLDLIRKEVSATAMRGLEENSKVEAFLLECTDLPPFAGDICRATNKPVFDFVTMMRWAVMSFDVGKYTLEGA